MKYKIYDVFISYRRKGGKNYARIIKPELEKRQLSVFLDFDELKDCKFDKRIMDAIDSSPVFLIILSEGALDRCVDDDDWVRKEIVYAYERGKHIIPVVVDKTFDKIPSDVPQEIKEILGQHQFSNIDTDALLQPSIDMLVEDWIKPHIKVENVEENSPCLKVDSDMSCMVYIDDEFRGQAEANTLKKIPLLQGEYKLKFVTLDGKDSVVGVFEMPEKDKIYKVELLPIKQQRETKEQQQQEAKERERREKAGNFEVNGVSFKMIKVEGGTFLMGAPESDTDAYEDEKPRHRVTLSDYYIGETAVTQELWKAVMRSNPSFFKGSNRPVESVSWDDCQTFVRKLNQLTGKKFRMPTEAEWEFAARGGNKSKGYKYSGSNNIDEVAWYDENSDNTTHIVKTKQPNELGLYDMSGNVWEWCQDWYDDYNRGSQTNPKGASEGSDRVFRGGSWDDFARFCRVSIRNYNPPDDRGNNLGFRLAL